jgi:pimeloyl-ACP methyl ester carboxylesterase
MSDLRHVSVNGHDLAYRMAGQGEAILLVHGIAASSVTWHDSMRALARRYRVVAPDLLGHGDSEKAAGDYSLGAHASFLRDLLRVLGIGPVTAVGHSFGGGIVLQLAYQHPEVCARIVLESSGGLGREVHSVLRVLSIPGAEFVLPVIAPSFVRKGGDALLGWIRRRGIRAPRVHEGWLAYSSLAEPGTRQAFVRELRSVVEFGGQIVSAKDRIQAATERPTLIVWGDGDSMIPVDHGRAAHELIPGSRLEIFEEAGHFPHAEYPDRYAGVLSEFIETTQPARGDSRAAPAHRLKR